MHVSCLLIIAATTPCKLQLAGAIYARSHDDDKNALKSFSCPASSRHLEILDELPNGGGFKARFGKAVHQNVPDGCVLREDEDGTQEPMSFLQMGAAGEFRKLQKRIFKALWKDEPAREQVPLIPYPKSVKEVSTSYPFVLASRTVVRLGAGLEDDDQAVMTLRQHIANVTGQIAENTEPESIISLELVDSYGADHESYKLTVGKTIELRAPARAGLFYGMQTLQQLISAATLDTHVRPGLIPGMVIDDAPAFKWRGLHLDVSRHFFPAEDVKKLLSTMAMFKLNRFHWHLTDDQGWRLPVPGYPELVRKGAGPRYTRDKLIDKGEGFEGSYTEQEIHDVVKFAKSKHIAVIPEVDVPGHCAAAISAYPELGNMDFAPPSGPQHEFGVHHWTLAPTNKSAAFLEAVFKQVVKLFPESKYIHLGGDEAPQDQWQRTSHEAKRLWEKFEGTNPQSYFNQKVSEIIHSHGRRMAGWDEVQSTSGLPRDVLIFAWRGENEIRKALRKGRHVVNAECGHLYLDHIQGPEESEPLAIAGPLTTVKDVYMYNPLPAWVQESQKHLVVGGQAQLWSEYFPTWAQVEYMAWPRAMALAERLWTPAEQASFPEFNARLRKRIDDLRRWGVNYHPLQY
jgi:hexosaminidase